MSSSVPQRPSFFLRKYQIPNLHWIRCFLFLGLTASCSSDEPYQIEGPKDCSIEEQNDFTYRLMREAYYWNEFVPEGVDTSSYESPDALMKAMRYAELDAWSRVADLATSDALFEEGKVLGFGFSARRTANGQVILAAVEEDSPAGEEELKRGDEVLRFNGETIEALDASGELSQVFGPEEPGVSLELEIKEQDGSLRTVDIVKAWFPLVTVPTTEIIEFEDLKVGYFVYNSFVEPSVDELNRAFEKFKQENVSELIVDLRYNGGGRLNVAEYLLDLLAGEPFQGKLSYRTEHAPALKDQDTVSNFSKLPLSLERLKKIVFITTASTASASELVANALEPYVEVLVVGSPSLGKPVGSSQWVFCDKAAQPIMIRILNANDEGDYYAGLPLDCAAADDLFFQLGDPSEASLRTALDLLKEKPCTTLVPEGIEARAPTLEARSVPPTPIAPLYRSNGILPELY